MPIASLSLRSLPVPCDQVVVPSSPFPRTRQASCEGSSPMLSAFRGELLGDMMSRLGSTLLGLSRPAFGISDLQRGHSTCRINYRRVCYP